MWLEGNIAPLCLLHTHLLDLGNLVCKHLYTFLWTVFKVNLDTMKANCVSSGEHVGARPVYGYTDKQNNTKQAHLP